MKDHLQVLIGFNLGNFIYQLLRTSPDWGVFIERSLFCFIFYMLLLVMGCLK